MCGRFEIDPRQGLVYERSHHWTIFYCRQLAWTNLSKSGVITVLFVKLTVISACDTWKEGRKYFI